MLKKGDIAPDFEADASDGSHFRLYGRPGLCTVVSFVHPGVNAFGKK